MSNPRKIINEPRSDLSGFYDKQFANPEFVNSVDINKSTDKNNEDNNCNYTNRYHYLSKVVVLQLYKWSSK